MSEESSWVEAFALENVNLSRALYSIDDEPILPCGSEFDAVANVWAGIWSRSGDG